MKHILLLILLTFVSASVFGQAWQDGGNGIQFRYIGDKREIRQLIKSPQPPYGVTDSLAKLEAFINKKDFLSTGLIDHAALSATIGGTTFNISAGHGVVANFDNHFYPSIKRVNITSKTGITPQFLTTAITSYVAIDSNDNVVQSASPFTDVQSRDLIILGAIIHSNLTNINAVNNIAKPVISNTNQLHDLYEAVGALNTAGNKYTANGANLNIDKSAGNLFKLGVNFINDWKSPSKLTIALQTAATFRYRTQTGIEFADRTTIDPGFYDVAGTRTAIPGSLNQFTIQRITLFQSGLTRIQYGQNIYANKSEAMAAMSTESFTTETNIAENGIFRAYLVVRANATTLNDLTQAEFIEVGKFGSPIGNAGGAVTSANIIAALGYTPENVANKATDFTTVNNTLYPTVQATKAYADNLVVGLLNDRGSYDASSNLYPSTGGSGTGGAILKGNLWAVSVAGTLGGVPVTIGDWLRALVDSPGQTSSNWSVVEGNFGYVPANVNGVNATGTWPISVTGNSATSTLWGGRGSELTTPTTGAFSHILGFNSGGDGLVRGKLVANAKADFGIGDGSTLTNNISGNAATASNSTLWNGFAWSGAAQPSPTLFLTTAGSAAGYSTASEVRVALGSPSGGETLQSVTARGSVLPLGGVINFYDTDYGIGTPESSGLQIYAKNGDIIRIGHKSGATFSDKINILPNGNIGIGYTTDQGYKLAVNGNASLGGKLSIATSTSPITPGDFGYNTSIGSYLYGKAGSINDYTLFNNSGNPVMQVPTGTVNSTFSGSVTATTYTGDATLTGTPTAPTPTAGDNSTKIATTAFVQDALSSGTSGTYIPTITGISNVASSSSTQKAHWNRVGNEVTVSGYFSVTVTTPNSAVTYEIDLPVASDLTALDDVTGFGDFHSSTGTTTSPRIDSSITNNKASFNYLPGSGTTHSLSFTFMYTVK